MWKGLPREPLPLSAHVCARPFRGSILATAKEGPVKKFLLLLGVLGLVIAAVIYIRGRQGENEFEL